MRWPGLSCNYAMTIKGEQMRVLVACEYSGRVRDAFTAQGHDAMSCDILPTDNPGPRYQGDVFDIINDGWDLIVAFPPCTHLSAAGAPSWKQKQADGRQDDALNFVYKIRDARCDLIAIENPTGRLNSHWRKPDQIINPLQFGDPFKKRTCLWLKGLPKLKDTSLVEPKFHYTSNSTRGGKLKDGTRRKSILPIFKNWDSSKERSQTLHGIANAMARQWGAPGG